VLDDDDSEEIESEGRALTSKQRDRVDLLVKAKAVARQYSGNLTLRQLYYQLVAAGDIANSQQSYKRLGDVIAQARLAGEFPFDWLLDRTRESRPGAFADRQIDVDEALDGALGDVADLPKTWLWTDRWYGQPMHVSVWVEKEALAGVFEAPCNRLGVSWFVLRGYSSLSSLYEWVKQVAEAAEKRSEANLPIEKCVILYFGDHDPDGWEIPRSALRNVEAIAQVAELDIPDVELRRVALTRQQIELHKPPPFPAKESSSRFDGYVREHGRAFGWTQPSQAKAWELDALNPRALTKLIEDNVRALFDESIFKEHADAVSSARSEFRERFVEDEFIERVARAMEES
jgi:hypothetical protein